VLAAIEFKAKSSHVGFVLKL